MPIMSRSRRKSPWVSLCSAKGQKLFRSKENRKHRKQAKEKIRKDECDKIPHVKEFGNEWKSPRDGKIWLGFFDKMWRRGK